MQIDVLSLFDGISCARVALKRAGFKVRKYYASDTDMWANQIAKKNWPDNIQLGNVKAVNKKVGKIDLLIGGSPCQDLSIAKQGRKGLSGDRSGLFWEYVRILHEVKPKYFILENVASMHKSQQEIISKALGVQPIMINAALLSAQTRKRLFWTNIPGVVLPKDRGIMLRDILEKDSETLIGATQINNSIKWGNAFSNKGKAFTIRAGNPNGIKTVRIGQIGKGGQGDRIYSVDGKSVNLSANGGGRGAKTGLYMIQTPRGKNKGGKKATNGKTPTLSSSSWEHNNKLVIPLKSKTIRSSGRGSGLGDKHNWDQFSDDGIIRKLTPIECERLQGLPDDYTRGISNTERYKVLGNAFNVDVIVHILKFIK